MWKCVNRCTCHHVVWLYQATSAHTILDNPSALLTHPTATVSLQALKARLPGCPNAPSGREANRIAAATNQGRLWSENSNFSLSLTTGQYITLDQPPIHKCAAERLATDVYNYCMLPKTGLFNSIRVFTTIIMLDEDGIPSTDSIDQSTTVPLVKFCRATTWIHAGKPVKKHNGLVYKGGRQNTPEQLWCTGRIRSQLHCASCLWMR